MKYSCCDQRRMEAVKQAKTLNGLEYLEVDDSGKPNDATRQRTLFVKFLKDVKNVPSAEKLTKDSFRIEGGERIKTVEIESVNTTTDTELGNYGITDKPAENFLKISTKFYGDFSQYTLRVVSGADSDALPSTFDPRLGEIQFSFKVQCPSDFDCASSTPCPTPPVNNPRLDYLARDYASFRRLMLDRMGTLMPDAGNRNAADAGVTVVELLAYVGDQLSYRQDAVATEAYLGTARMRTSLRRHARLVDYMVHEGCNARVWVQVSVSADGVNIPAHTPLLTRVSNTHDRIPEASDQLRDAMMQNPVVFETVEDTLLYKDYNEMSFYTWGERECCLPKGATRATLKGKYPKLKAGDVLVLVEKIGPRTGIDKDADRTHRWAVRLTDVRLGKDPSGSLFDNPNKDVTEIQWAQQDALPFPLCLSATTDKDHGAAYIPEVSKVLGNIVLADHGRTIKGERLGAVPASRITLAAVNGKQSCERPDLKAVPPRFRPKLAESPLTHYLPPPAKSLFSINLADLATTDSVLDALKSHGVILRKAMAVVQGGDGMWSVSDGDNAYSLRLVDGLVQVSPLEDAAVRMTAADPQRARPYVMLDENLQDKYIWQPRPDLLGSNAEATEFVAECENDGSAFLRFGDDEHGKMPDSGTTFQALYRIGNGTVGNIGLESIAHIVSNDGRLLAASNPLPAQGGTEPESAEAIRRDAPEAFRIQERAVTPEDYAEVTQRHPSVQRAAATFRWTGSWYTVFITVDRKGGGEVDEPYKQTIRDHVERYRMAGYDLEVNGPSYISLQLEMKVCVKPDYFRGDVRAALMCVFSRGWMPDGSRALFHPDNFTFGQSVYPSKLYDAAQSIEGVLSVEINKFQRLREPDDPKPLADGEIKMGRLEIARLDNDPSFPERGVFKLTLGGGK